MAFAMGRFAPKGSDVLALGAFGAPHAFGDWSAHPLAYEAVGRLLPTLPAGPGEFR